MMIAIVVLESIDGVETQIHVVLVLQKMEVVQNELHHRDHKMKKKIIITVCISKLSQVWAMNGKEIES